MANIVISYRREDTKWIADRVFDRLEARYGKGSVFMDIDSIPYGLDFREHIRQTINDCDVMVALIGPNWVGRGQDANHARIFSETDWVRIEIETALNKKIPLIPLLIDASLLPKPAELPESLRDIVFRNAAPIDRDNFRAQMDKVIASIDRHLSKGAEQARSPRPAVHERVEPVRPPQKIVQPEMHGEKLLKKSDRKKTAVTSTLLIVSGCMSIAIGISIGQYTFLVPGFGCLLLAIVFLVKH